jgi:hypothetical protein
VRGKEADHHLHRGDFQRLGETHGALTVRGFSGLGISPGKCPAQPLGRPLFHHFLRSVGVHAPVYPCAGAKRHSPQAQRHLTSHREWSVSRRMICHFRHLYQVACRTAAGRCLPKAWRYAPRTLPSSLRGSMRPTTRGHHPWLLAATGTTTGKILDPKTPTR